MNDRKRDSQETRLTSFALNAKLAEGFSFLQNYRGEGTDSGDARGEEGN